MLNEFSEENGANNPNFNNVATGAEVVSSAARTVASMVDESRLLKVVKRLFNGSVKEVLGELLQNSQRAGAKNIRFTATDTVLTISDDGSGLAGDGADKFSSLMRIAESSYSRAEVTDQDPMGVGLFSLFALHEVSKVVISSNGYAMSVDTDRLWNEDGYWQAWRNRVSRLEEWNLQSGLTLAITAAPALLKAVTTNLTSTHSNFLSAEYGYDYTSAARGYDGILNVFLNGERLDTSCDFAQEFTEKLIETTYQGNRLLIGVDDAPRANVVNWHGQLIRSFKSRLRFYLEVRHNRPLNPLSPSRRGIIEDEAYREFLKFLAAQIRQYILKSPAESITPVLIEGVYAFDRAWADEFCPYLTAMRWEHDASESSFEDWAGSSLSKKEVLAYAASPLMLDEAVALAERDAESGILSTSETFYYGAQSFVPVIEKTFGKPAYELASGNRERLVMQQLWWLPGKDLESFFVEAGEFTLCDAKITDVPETGWQKVGEETVFAFDDAENWDIANIDKLQVGVRDDLRAKLDFLNSAAWCIWSSMNDEVDSETMQRAYGESLEEAKARLFTDCLPDETLDMWRIGSYFKLDKDEVITNLDFEYPPQEDEQPAEAEKKSNLLKAQPIAVTVSTNRRRNLRREFLRSAEARLAA